MTTNLDSLSFLNPPQGPGEIGRLGSYRVLKLLGKGGMGAVFLAEDPQLQRTVALKVMLPETAKKAASRERFLREARATAKIEHDHIVTIYQVGEDRGVPYLAMQMLKGTTLEDLLKKKQGKTGMPLGLDQILKLGREVARGLAAAHEHNLIHRDIKPANIWLDASAGGRVKILDFGLVRANEESRLTTLGAVVGTPAYMAPEQARTDKIDARADLFSLGVVLYRLCTGRLPWLGNEASETVIAMLTEEPTPVQELNPNLPPRLAKLITMLLAKKADDRPQSAKAVADALQSIERQQPAVQMPVAAPVPVPAQAKADGAWHDRREATGVVVEPPAYKVRARRRRSLWVVGGLAATAVLALIAALTMLSGGAGKTSEGKELAARATGPSSTPKLTPSTRAKDQEPRPDPKPKDPDTRPKELDPAVKYDVNSIGMRLAPIPAGEFMMGASEEVSHRYNNKPFTPEGPPHNVKITKSFYLGATHVTVGQFRTFIQATNHKPQAGDKFKPGFGQTDEHPVINVTWNDAVAFCKWLSEKEGKKYRLPTEAEWEYACRAGSRTAYYFGDDPGQLQKYAWFKGNTEKGTHPVGQLVPNKWGLYDMHGLAYQWTADWFAPDYYKNSPELDPPGSGPTMVGDRKEPSKVMRGGEWWYDAWQCRCASRKDRTPNFTARSSFRVLCER